MTVHQTPQPVNTDAVSAYPPELKAEANAQYGKPELGRMSALALVRLCDRTLDQAQRNLDDARDQLNALAELFGFRRTSSPDDTDH